MRKNLFIFLWIIPFLVHAKANIQEGQIKAQTCIACHGEKGISLNKDWPNLAGQNANYISKQLKDFKEKKQRDNPLMSPFLQNLTEEDFSNLAAYFASLPAPETLKKQEDPKAQQLYKAGDSKKHITACIACHGPKAKGNASAGFPALAGQKADYLIAQMLAFKTGKRNNDLQSIMRDISVRMSQDEIELIAHYLEGL